MTSKEFETLEVLNQLKDFALEHTKNGFGRRYVIGSCNIIEEKLKQYKNIEKDFEKLRVTIRDFLNSEWERLNYELRSPKDYKECNRAFSLYDLKKEHGEDAKYFWAARFILRDYTLEEVKELMK